MKYIILLFLIFIVVMVFFALGIYNHQTVTFNYLLGKRDLQISSLVIISFIIGAIINWFLFILFWICNFIKLIKSKRKIKHLEKKLSQIKKNH